MRLRFTIRDLLWLTLVVAMGVAWWVSSHRVTPKPRYTVELRGANLLPILKDNETRKTWTRIDTLPYLKDDGTLGKTDINDVWVRTLAD